MDVYELEAYFLDYDMIKKWIEYFNLSIEKSNCFGLRMWDVWTKTTCVELHRKGRSPKTKRTEFPLNNLPNKVHSKILDIGLDTALKYGVTLVFFCNGLYDRKKPSSGTYISDTYTDSWDSSAGNKDLINSEAPNPLIFVRCNRISFDNFFFKSISDTKEKQ